MLILKIVVEQKCISSGQLANTAYLSHPTVTSILDRLVKKTYITRKKDTVDKRKVIVRSTESARLLFAKILLCYKNNL